MFWPTDRIIKFTTGVRFGRKGLRPDLFKSYSFESAAKMLLIDADSSKLEAPLSASDLSTELHDPNERREQMTNWVEKVMPRSLAEYLTAFSDWGADSLKHDREGLWTFTDWKLLIADTLDELTRHLDTQLDVVKVECDGGANQKSFTRRCRSAA